MIDEIRKRLEAATAEPYACRYEICWTRGYDTIQKIGNVVGGKDVDLNIITSDHSFIAHALTDIACLLERVEKLEAVREAVNQYLEVYELSGEYHDWRIRELAALDKLKATLAVCEEVIDD